MCCHSVVALPRAGPRVRVLCVCACGKQTGADGMLHPSVCVSHDCRMLRAAGVSTVLVSESDRIA